MKPLCALFSAMLICNLCLSQNLLTNGSFETNTAIGNTTNLSSNWPNYVSDSWEIDGGVMNLLTSGICGTASDGTWYVTNCPGCGAAEYIAFSLKLSAPLVSGNQYTVIFDKKYCGDSTAIEIGITNDSTLLTTPVHTFSGPATSGWVQDSFIFQAPAAANYLAVAVDVMPGGTGFIALDNFQLYAGAVAVNELSAYQSSVHIYPNPVGDELKIQNAELKINKIEIYNVFGEKVYSQKPVTGNLEHITADVSRLVPGIYFLRVFDSQKSLLQKLVIE